jgi:uncharacterized protein (DUF1501 family)
MPPRLPAPGGPSAFLTRRRLLQLGGLSALGLGLPELLRAGAPAAGGGRGPERSCIFIVQYGGASHIDSLDPKPDAPAEVRGPYKAIATSVPGVRVGELLPRLARLADRYCLVRSMSHGNGGHDGGMHVCMTGHSRPAENTPYYGSVLARLRPSPRNVPPYVWLQNLAGDVQPRYLSGGFLGPAYAPLRVGTDLDNPSAPGFRVRAFDPPADVPPARLRGRQRLLAAVEPEGKPLARTAAGAALGRFQERAVELVTGPEARRAFDLGREPPALRDRYGRGPLGQNLLLARRLIEAGVRLVSVTAWAGLPTGEKFRNVQTWDMHGDGAGLGSIFGTGHFGLGWALPRLDEAVSALLEDLEQRGLLDETLVVCLGEFGRAPKVAVESNFAGTSPGRKHWAAVYSIVLAGAGVARGGVVGSSDRMGAYPNCQPVGPWDVMATLFAALGVDPAGHYKDLVEQPHAITTGKPIAALYH